MLILSLFFLFISQNLYSSWAEELLKNMTPEEKIGQLFVIPACPARDESHIQDVYCLLSEYHIGGIILKEGSPDDYRHFMKRLTNMTKVPLLYYVDAEWGLGMRMKETISFPKNLALGAISNNALIQELGQEIGKQCHSLGIHVNLAPVADVNTNPNNPVIHKRSFGQDPFQVSKKASLMMKGLQEHVMTCGKHFPGHGDTISDSHETLPLLTHSLQRLENVEFIPFKELIREGIDLIMTAHLLVPALSPKPCTFSYEVVTELLQKHLGFKGLIITDALNMKALTKLYSFSEIGLQAFLAGHDLLLYGDHIAPQVDHILKVQIPEAYQAILQGFQNELFTIQDLDRRVLKILKAKEKFSLQPRESIDKETALLLKEKLFRHAITLVNYKKELIPLGQELHIISVYPKDLSAANIAKINAQFQEHKNSVLVLYDSPYFLKLFQGFNAAIVAYEDDPIAEKVVFALIQNRGPFLGHLPVNP